MGIIAASLAVWVGAFALIVSGTSGQSSGAPIASIPTDTPMPASAYAQMLQNIASRAPDASSLWASGDSSGNTAAGPKTGASPTKTKAGGRTHKSSAHRVGVAVAGGQASTNQALLSTLGASSSTLPSATSTAASSSSSSSTTTTTTTTVGNPPPTGPVTSVNDPRLTPAQAAAAQALIDRTRFAMGQFTTEQSVLNAGYVWIGDTDKNGYQTYVNYSYLADGNELDATHIEAIILQRAASGTATVVAAVYILEPPKTMANVPDIAGALTTWHARADLCRSTSTGALSPQLAGGACATGSVAVVMPPSLNVWPVAGTCGPFATTTADPTTCLG